MFTMIHLFTVDMDMMPSDDGTQNDEQEGSGSDPQIMDTEQANSATSVSVLYLYNLIFKSLSLSILLKKTSHTQKEV